MKTSKFTETQIVSILKQSDAGAPVKDVCRQAGISVATYYQWKSKYGGLEASELRRVKELEAENAQLKRMYAELACPYFFFRYHENRRIRSMVSVSITASRTDSTRFNAMLKRCLALPSVATPCQT